MEGSSPSIYDLTAGGVLAFFVIKEVLGFVLKSRKGEDERSRTAMAGEKSSDFWIKAIDEIIARHAERLRREADGRLRAVEQVLARRADELKQETEANRLLLRQIREDQIRRGERDDARRGPRRYDEK